MSKSHRLIFNISLAAVLTSIGVVFKVLSFTTPFVRITFFDTILIFSGLILGPILGLAVSFSVDVLDFILFSKGFAFSYIILFGTMLTGLIPGLFVIINKKLTGNYILSNIVLFITIILSTTTAFLITTYQMYLWYGMGFIADLPFRLIFTIVKWPIQFYLIKIIYNKFLDKLPLND